VKYVQPHGINDPNAPYINGDPSIARQGSIPPAAAFEHPMREIVAVIQKNKLIPNEANLMQMLEGIRSQRSNYAEDTGSVNNISVSYDPPLSQYTLGLLLRVRIHSTNTSSVTIDAGAGRVAIKRMDGSNVQPNDMPAGGLADLAYDGTAFQMLNFLGAGAGGDGGTIINNYSNLPFCVDTSTTANIITAPFSPAITTVAAGDAVLVQVSNTVTGPTTIKINALTSQIVKAASGGDLLPGDINVGDVKLFVFDGTNWQIEPNVLIATSLTIQVPLQYPTPQAAINALSRKNIHAAATVTIQLGIGTFAPFTIFHHNSDHITIKGTMKAAAPVFSNFQISGSGASQRYNDAMANLNMLRSRYGSEIHCASGQYGIQNLGPGKPILRDLLVTGNYAADSTTGVVVGGGKQLQCNNVTSWGHGYTCFLVTTGAFLEMYDCFGDGGQWCGLISMSGGTAFSQNTSYISCGLSGINVDYHATLMMSGGGINSNAVFGLSNVDMSYARCQSVTSVSNGTWDMEAQALSIIQGVTCGWMASSPDTNGGPGNWGSYIFSS